MSATTHVIKSNLLPFPNEAGIIQTKFPNEGTIIEVEHEHEKGVLVQVYHDPKMPSQWVNFFTCTEGELIDETYVQYYEYAGWFMYEGKRRYLFQPKEPRP